MTSAISLAGGPPAPNAPARLNRYIQIDFDQAIRDHNKISSLKMRTIYLQAGALIGVAALIYVVVFAVVAASPFYLIPLSILSATALKRLAKLSRPDYQASKREEKAAKREQVIKTKTANIQALPQDFARRTLGLLPLNTLKPIVARFEYYKERAARLHTEAQALVQQNKETEALALRDKGFKAEAKSSYAYHVIYNPYDDRDIPDVLKFESTKERTFDGGQKFIKFNDATKGSIPVDRFKDLRWDIHLLANRLFA